MDDEGAVINIRGITEGNSGNGGMTRQIGSDKAHADQPKQNDAPNHAAEILSLAPAIAIPQNMA
jgi:hypothetical protein